MKHSFASSALALSLLSPAVLAADGSEPVFTPEGMRAHVAFLADDLLEGRDIGSRGHEIAARYVATRFDAFGLKPAGDDGGWYQTITFQETDRAATPGTVTISGSGREKTWAHATDVFVALNPLAPTLDVAAPLVFVGYGIEDVRMSLDDRPKAAKIGK